MRSIRVLIVEEDAEERELIAEALEAQGISAFSCVSYRDLENYLSLPIASFDVIILSHFIDGRDTSFQIPRIRQAFRDAKILSTSRFDNQMERTLLLKIGADDFLVKPLLPDSLIARIRIFFEDGIPESGS